MTIPLNDLAREHVHLADALENCVRRVLRSGHYVFGPELQAFEAEFAEHLGVDRVVGTGNGTDALELALRAVGAGPGRPVVVAGNAGAYAAVAAAATGAPVVVADVDADRLLLDPAAAAAACAAGTAAVVVTHLYGRAADVRSLRAALPAGVAVVEDCAQAAGASLDGARCGSLGDLAAFSFYPTKNLGAAGDGGAVACSARWADQVVALRQYGWSERYTVGTPGGRNSRLDELQAAVLRVKLPHLDSWARRRREVAGAYADAASGTPFAFPRPRPGDAPHLAVGQHPDRAAFAARLAGAGVGTAVHYPVPDHHQPGLDVRTGPGGAVRTELACRRVLSVPMSPHLTADEVARVAAAVRTHA